MRLLWLSPVALLVIDTFVVLCHSMTSEWIGSERSSPPPEGRSRRTSEPRMSLWSVPARWAGAFFVLLVAQGAFLVGTQAWRTTVNVADSHVVDTVMSIVLVAAPLMLVAGIMSMIELEVALTLSAWFEWWRQKREEEKLEEGIAIGRRLEREESRWKTSHRAERGANGDKRDGLQRVSKRNPYV